MICPEYAKQEAHTRAMCLENKQSGQIKNNLKSVIEAVLARRYTCQTLPSAVSNPGTDGIMYA